MIFRLDFDLPSQQTARGKDDPSETRIRITGRRRALIYAIYLSVLVLLFVAAAEAIVRSKGYGPWRPIDISIRVDPGGKFFRRHATLGYSHIPGRFRVTLGSGYAFDVTHGPDTLRITHPLDVPKQQREGWIFGCSFTHGWSLNDDETYPWLLQKPFPECEVVNFGVSGYGTIHSLLQFRSALEGKAPAIAVLAYSGLHDERNTFLRTRRKGIAPWNKLGPLEQPYARLNEEGGLQYSFANTEYLEFPFMRSSALAHFLEITYNQLEARWYRSHAVSEALIKDMAELAKKHGVTLVVANIYGSREDLYYTGLGREILEFAEENGIPNVDMSVDLSLPQNKNLPHDGHPSAKANQQYANKLEAFLRAALPK
jgi:hypothetical protein